MIALTGLRPRVALLPGGQDLMRVKYRALPPPMMDLCRITQGSPVTTADHA